MALEVASQQFILAPPQPPPPPSQMRPSTPLDLRPLKIDIQSRGHTSLRFPVVRVIRGRVKSQITSYSLLYPFYKMIP